MPGPLVDIIIVDYNSGLLLRKCLESIAAHPPESGSIDRIVVVDNNSSDASRNYIEGLELPIRLIENEENRGFSAACNQGARNSKANYLLFLNPDTELISGSLDVPILFMERPENQPIGIIGIQLLGNDGKVARTCSYHPRLIHFFNKAFGLDYLWSELFTSGLMKGWAHDSSRKVDVVMGAFYFVRRSVFEMLRGFDERFFVYFEENEFGLRAQQIGYSSYYLCQAQAYHVSCGSSNKVRAERLHYSLQSRIRYGFKHFGWFSATILVFLTLCVEPVSRIVLAIVRHSRTEIKEIVQGYLMLWWSFLKSISYVGKRKVAKRGGCQS